MDPVTLWWIAIVLAVVVTLVVAALLTIILRTARDIEHGAAIVWANGQRVASLIQSGLVAIDDAGRAVPELAESFTATSPTTYRFTLRRGLTFHDGTPLTADDVAYTYASIKDPETGSPLGPRFARINSVTAVDPLTVDVELDQPFPPVLIDLKLGIVPKRLEDPAYREAFATHPVGAGPFRFVARPDEEHIELEPFDDYHGGRPGIDRLEVVVVRDETTRVLSLLGGEADLLINAVSPVLLKRLARSPRLNVIEKGGAGYAYMGLNVRNPPLDDVRVRRAFAHALDRTSLARYKFHGTARPAVGMMAEGHWAYGAAPAYPYDPERAKALLDEAGYPDPDGEGPLKRFTITYKTSTDRFRGSIALVLKKQLEAVGVGVDLRASEWGTFFGDVKRARFEVVTLKWPAVIEPHLMHWVFHSGSTPTEENGYLGGNRGGYVNPEADRLLDEAAREVDPEARGAMYAEVQRILGEELPYVPLWHEASVAILSDRLEGFAASPFGFLDPLKRARAR